MNDPNPLTDQFSIAEKQVQVKQAEQNLEAQKMNIAFALAQQKFRQGVVTALLIMSLPVVAMFYVWLFQQWVT